MKNARDAFYRYKGKQKKIYRKEARRNKRIEKKAKQHQSQLKRKIKDVIDVEKVSVYLYFYFYEVDFSDNVDCFADCSIM